MYLPNSQKTKYSKAIVACFFLFCCKSLISQTANSTIGCAPVTINFTAPVGVSSFFWDFKDGATSTLQNPSNTFLTAGVYDVEFSETVGGSVFGIVTITIYDVPQLQITPLTPMNGCVPLDFQVINSTALPAGITPTSNSWTFGNGTGSNLDTGATIYTSSGLFDVSLQLTTSVPSCNTSQIFSDTVEATQPEANFTTSPNPPSTCNPPLVVSFTNSSSPSPLSYLWTFGNGSTSASQIPPAQTYAADGLYETKLVVTDVNGCMDSISTFVSVGSPVASFTVPDTVCLYNPFFVVNDFPGTTASYLYDAGTIQLPSNTSNPRIMYQSEGLRSIQMIVTSNNGACADTSTQFVFAEDPKVEFISTPSYACKTPFTTTYQSSSTYNISQYDWIFFGGDTSSLPHPTKTFDIDFLAYHRKGLTPLNAMLTAVTANGCTATYSASDTIHFPWARLMPDVAAGCVPLQVNFYDSSRSNESIINWTWDFGDGTPWVSNTNGNPVAHTFTSPGTYSARLMIANAGGCFDTSHTVEIYVSDSLIPSFASSDSSICIGDTVQFYNTTVDTNSNSYYQYFIGNQSIGGCVSGDTSLYVADDTVGIFAVQLRSVNQGCERTSTQSTSLEIKGALARFEYTFDCDSSTLLQLENRSLNANSSVLSMGDGNVYINPSILSHNYDSTGDYSIMLTATDTNSTCASDIDSLTFPIRFLQASVTFNETVCLGANMELDASPSVDYITRCGTGIKWFFGDPVLRPKNGTNPLVSVESESVGLQTVTLVLEDANGCFDTLVNEITVLNIEARINKNSVILCSPDSIVLADSSLSDTTLVNWEWNFSSLDTLYGDTVSFFYTQMPPFPHLVYLKAQDASGCTSEDTLFIQFFDPQSTVSILDDDQNICLGDSLKLNATDYTQVGSGLEFFWKFSEQDSSSLQAPIFVYDSIGEYQVYYRYTEKTSGCLRFDTLDISIKAIPSADFITDLDSATGLCAPQNLQLVSLPLTNDSILSYWWDFGNGQFGSDSVVSTVYNKGTFTVTHALSSEFSCTDTAQRVLNVYNTSGDFETDRDSVCLGESVLFTLIDTSDVFGFIWDFGDGISSSDSAIILHNYSFEPPSGQTVAKLTVLGPDSSCPVTSQQPIRIESVHSGFRIEIENDTNICLGNPISFINESTNSDVFSWLVNDAVLANSSDFENVFFDTLGAYSIQLISALSALGCTDSSNQTVVVHPLPLIQTQGDTICFGDNFQLQSFSSYTNLVYQWTYQSFISQDKDPTGSVEESSFIQLQVTDSLDCQSKDSAFVRVIPKITTQDFDTTIIIGDQIQLPYPQIPEGYVFSWISDSLPTCLQCPDPQVQPLSGPVFYSLEVQDTFGCFKNTVVYTIEVIEEGRVKLPTTFSPNDDGRNDVLFVEGWGIRELKYFKIFNRWGQLLFVSNSLEEGWNGYYNGVLQNNEIYVYQVLVDTYTNEELFEEGYVKLVR